MSWARRHRVPEILCGLVVNAVALAGNKLLPVFQRPVPEIQLRLPGAGAEGGEVVYTARNPELDYPLVAEQLPMAVVTVMMLGIPWLLVNLSTLVVRVPKRFKRAVAVWWLQGHALNNFFTHTIKCFAGRPRPNFYALVADGRPNIARKSFPSGHTSSTATAMCMLSLLLLDMLPFHPRYRPHRARFFFLRFLCVALPGIFTLWVGVTRTQDNWHNFSDVLGGLIIGTMCGLASYYLEGVGNALSPGARMSSTASEFATGLEMMRNSDGRRPTSASPEPDDDDEPVVAYGTGSSLSLGLASMSPGGMSDRDGFQQWPSPLPKGRDELNGGRPAVRAPGAMGGDGGFNFDRAFPGGHGASMMRGRSRAGLSHASIQSHGI